MKETKTQRLMRNSESHEAGFSLIELMIAMTITLVIMVAASTLLSKSLGTRSRENRKSDSLADVQRALNIMSREIANSGFGLMNGSATDNGIVLANSNSTQIRFRANIINSSSNNTISNPGEDVTYYLDNFRLARYDLYAPAGSQTTALLANRIDTLTIGYYDVDGAGNVSAVAAAAPTANTVRVKITASVTLPVMSGEPGSTEQLTSEVSLRNAPTVVGSY
jgi:prepilin-type N-terminal cleavage/methylation domain-containing protein